MQGWHVHTLSTSILRHKLKIAALQLPPDEGWQVAEYDSMLAEAYKGILRRLYS